MTFTNKRDAASEEDHASTTTRETSKTSESSARETTTSSNDDEDEDEDEDKKDEDDEDDEDKKTSTVRDQNTAVPETGTKTGTAGHRTTSLSINPAGYAGAIEMLTPNTVQVASALYKIGDNIELAWNYTNVIATPTAIDVLVSCSAASETWTLTANMTFETEVNFLWETKDDADNVDRPLLTEKYTLIVKDVDAEVTERAAAGYLGAYSGFTFGLYRPAAYTPLSEWECSTCNAGPGGFDTQALRLAVTMALITVCSFTWFVTGLGLQ